MNDISISELERRMRPGEWSKKGFLGPNERLIDVIRDTDIILKKIKITHEQIAGKIEELLAQSINKNIDTPINMGNFSIIIKRTLGWQSCPWAKNPPLEPCIIGKGPNYTSIDFVIINNNTKEQLKGPGLIVHLVRDHHFFEGLHSPYHVDPEKAARVLELKPREKDP